MKPLSESQKRVLRRIAAQMVDGASGVVKIVLHEGGVRGYEESRTYRPGDMEDVAESLAMEVDRATDLTTAPA